MESPDKLMNTAETAAYLGRPVGTLRQWRHKHVGPACFRMLGSVVYRQSAVAQWLADLESADSRKTA
jgi:hypothetical protein